MRETLRAIFEPQLREGLGKIQPLTPEGTQLLIEGFLTYLDGTLKDVQLLYSLGLQLDRETLLKKLTASDYLDWLSIQYLRYIDYRKKIDETYQESKSWGEVFSTHVYEYSEEAEEAFIDAVEEKHKTKVKDAKHLSKLTGITELYNYWDKEKGFLNDDEAEALAKKTKRPLKSFKATPAQSRAEALRQLQDTLIGSREAKYHRALEVALQSGAKYKELLDIEPKDYGLTTEPWQSYGRNTKRSSILGTIGDAFLIYEPGGLMVRPSLRAIAQELEAPYSVLMEAFKLMRGGVEIEVKDPEGYIKASTDRIDKFEERLRKAILTYIEKQPSQWRKDRLLTSKESIKDYTDMFFIWYKTVLREELTPGIEYPSKEMETIRKGIIKSWRAEFKDDFKKYLEEGKKVYSAPKIINA